MFEDAFMRMPHRPLIRIRLDCSESTYNMALAGTLLPRAVDDGRLSLWSTSDIWKDIRREDLPSTSTEQIVGTSRISLTPFQRYRLMTRSSDEEKDVYLRQLLEVVSKKIVSVGEPLTSDTSNVEVEPNSHVSVIL